MITKTAKWWKALLAAIITGASSSGLSALGVTVADAAGMNVGTLNLKQLGVMALCGGLGGALAYLKQSPVPPDDDDEPTFPKVPLILLMAALALPTVGILTGCNTPGQTQAVAFKTLASTQIAVDKAMRVYGEACVTGKASLSQQIKVDAAHAKYRAAFRLAVSIARSDLKSPTPESVSNAAVELTALIQAL